jgi:hypothetical protein
MSRSLTATLQVQGAGPGPDVHLVSADHAGATVSVIVRGIDAEMFLGRPKAGERFSLVLAPLDGGAS